MNSGSFQWDLAVWLTDVAPSASKVFCYHLSPLNSRALIIRGYFHSLHEAVVPLVGAVDRRRTHQSSLELHLSSCHRSLMAPPLENPTESSEMAKEGM